jgi:Trk K+ transport system NAD-binding subunit
LTTPDFQVICTKLGLENVIVPDRDIGECLADLVEGHDVADLSAVVETGIRLFHFVVREQDAGRIGELDLPEQARVIDITRSDDSIIVDDDVELKADDRILVVAHRDDLEQLKKRFARMEEG